MSGTATREKILDAGVNLGNPSNAPHGTAPHYSFDFFQWFNLNVVPPAFFLGVALAFVFCSVAGQQVKNQNIFHHFHRFHQGIEPVSLFYPTIRELQALVRSKVHAGQIPVIIGGSSVFNGISQPVEQLWSDQLQEILGSRYSVVNLAIRGAEPFDAGYLVAESLRDVYPNLIYTTNGNPGQTGPACGGKPYNYLFWQALYGGLLISDRARDDEIQRALANHPGEQGELQLGAILNNFLCFNEVWNTIAMRWFSTVWHQQATIPFYRDLCPARKRLADYTVPLPSTKQRYLEQQKIYASDMEVLREISQYSFVQNSKAQWIPEKSYWSDFHRRATAIVPAQMRRHILVIQVPNSPYYIKRLSWDEQIRQSKVYREGPRQWEKAGFNSATIGDDFSEDDYADRCHLSPSGGAKLAHKIAPEIIRVSNKLAEH